MFAKPSMFVICHQILSRRVVSLLDQVGFANYFSLDANDGCPLGDGTLELEDPLPPSARSRVGLLCGFDSKGCKFKFSL